MKKWTKGTAVIVSSAMVISMAGCKKQEPAADVSASETMVEEAIIAEGNVEPVDFTGGTPWVDSDMKSNIAEDMETSPKDDFHLYVNKDWLVSNEIPAGSSENSSVEEVTMETNKKIQSILTDQSLTGHNAELVQGFYEKYLDWDTRNAAGVKPLQEKIDKVKAITSLDELSAFLCSDETYFYQGLIDMYSLVKLDDPSEYTVKISGVDLLMGDPETYRDGESEELMAMQYEVTKTGIAKMMVRLGYTQDEAEKIFDDMIGFEKKLAEKSYTYSEIGDSDSYTRENNMVDLEELKSESLSYPLAGILEARGYADSKDFQLANPAYLEKLNELYTEDNLESIKNYMIIHAISSDMESLDQESKDIAEEMRASMDGSEEPTDEEVAMKRVHSRLAGPLAQVYLEQYGSEKMKSDVTELCEEIISYYRVMLENEEWISEETKAQAINKLDHIAIHAVYPDKWVDYSELDISEDSYYEARKKIELFDQQVSAGKVNQKVDKDLWNTMSILQFDASYAI